MKTLYRRVSRDLRDRCVVARHSYDYKLTEAEVQTLAKVADGFGNFDVTKQEYDEAKMILDRLGA